ncbi:MULTISPECIES: MarR family winged helix-turn-helix transcriptional regulator [unclassified Streptomyces]|uniref:MarR family winged helix-turn-helix transcriptional regulator n=1 Tax=unclassified Streptomyces TaxID=2593676 RepID=UPI0037034DAB
MAEALDLNRYAGHLIRRAEQIHTSLWSRHVSETVTSQQFAVLNALRDRAGIDQRTVARLTSLDRSTTHHIVRRLTEQNLISRVRDETDRRRTLLALTAGGRMLHASLAPSAEKINDELLSVFPEERRAEAMHVLARLSQREPVRTRETF